MTSLVGSGIQGLWLQHYAITPVLFSSVGDSLTNKSGLSSEFTAGSFLEVVGGVVAPPHPGGSWAWMIGLKVINFFLKGQCNNNFF